jgi:hypothetical protein
MSRDQEASSLAAGEAAAATGGKVGRLLQATARAEQIVREETELLRSSSSTDLLQFTYRKSQCLLELTRARAEFSDHVVTSELAVRFDSLRNSLAENADLLRVHMEAAREVAEAIADVMRIEMSDGTYSQPLATRTAPAQTGSA